MPCTVNEMLTVCRCELGYTENPPGSNRTKYGEWYGLNGQPWCDMFISWCGHVVGATDIIGKFSYTPSHAKWFYNQRRWGHEPKVGAIAFFAFYGSDYGGRWLGIHHVGIVESVRPDGFLITIEGNTSNDSNDNGGAVMRRIRHPRNIAGYGYPAYEEANTVSDYRVVVVEAKTKKFRDAIHKKVESVAHAVLGRSIVFHGHLDVVKPIEAFIAENAEYVKRTHGVVVEQGTHTPLNKTLPHGAFTDEEAFPAPNEATEASLLQAQQQLQEAEEEIALLRTERDTALKALQSIEEIINGLD